MPFVSTLIAASMLLAQNGDKTFSDADLGLSFQYPKEWTMRKERLYSVFEIPLADKKKAEVQVIATRFGAKAEEWQIAQVDVSKTLKRVVEKQWEEQILGVPLLMTKISFNEDNTDKNVLVGLLYSATPLKLNYRMTVPATGFDEAESKWRKVMSSLRTISGDLPGVENPNNSSSSTGSNTGEKVVVLKPETGPPKKPRKGDQKVPVNILGQELVVRIPKGWMMQPGEGSEYILTNKSLKGKLTFTIESGNQNDAKKLMLSKAGEAVKLFTKVTLREDREGTYSPAGAMMSSVERFGTGANGPLMMKHVSGQSGLLFYNATYIGEGKDTGKKDEGLLSKLFEEMIVEPKS